MEHIYTLPEFIKRSANSAVNVSQIVTVYIDREDNRVYYRTIHDQEPYDRCIVAESHTQKWIEYFKLGGK